MRRGTDQGLWKSDKCDDFGRLRFFRSPRPAHRGPHDPSLRQSFVSSKSRRPKPRVRFSYPKDDSPEEDDMTADSGIPMNTAEALDRVGEDEAFLQELLNMYAAQYAEKTSAIENAIRAADFQAIRDLGHSLKGSSANLSLPRLQDAAFDMETAGLGKDLEAALKALDRLEQEYCRLKDYIGTP